MMMNVGDFLKGENNRRRHKMFEANKKANGMLWDTNTYRTQRSKKKTAQEQKEAEAGKKVNH